MKKTNKTLSVLIVSAVMFFIFLMLPNKMFASEGDLIWSKPITPNFRQDIVSDSTNVYVINTSSDASDVWYIEKFSLDGISLRSAMSGVRKARAIAIDSSSIYIAGSNSDATRWIVEKRSKADLSLEWVYQDLSVAGNVAAAFDVAVDSSGVYVVGSDSSVFNQTRWKIKKIGFSKEEIWTKYSDPSSVVDTPRSVTVDSSGVYVGGFQDFDNLSPANSKWRVEKRDLDTGEPVWASAVIIDPSATLSAFPEDVRGITGNGTDIYIMGIDFSGGLYGYRIERRSAATGALIGVKSGSGSRYIYEDIGISPTGVYLIGYFYNPPTINWSVIKLPLNLSFLNWSKVGDPISGYGWSMNINSFGSGGIYGTGWNSVSGRLEKRCLISCPPTASFTVTPPSGTTSTTFNVDASGSSDPETPLADLRVRWDWENDGTWDTGWSATKTNSHIYSTAGVKTIKMEVKDTGGLTDDMIRHVSVVSISPPTADDQSIEMDQNTAVGIILSGNGGNSNSIIDIAAGKDFSLAVRGDGKVWSWGHNQLGKLGIGTFDPYKTTPVLVKDTAGADLTDIIAVSAGSYEGNHALALKSDGTVVAWGANGSGQLGDGTTISSNLPVQVKGPGGVSVLDDIIAVSAATRHSLALDSNGTVWAWGSENQGEIGNGNIFEDTKTPVKVRVTGGGILDNIIAISAGDTTSLALKSNGTVWAWGAPYTGDGTGNIRTAAVQVRTKTGVLNDIIAIAIDYRSGPHAVALRKDGIVYTWGNNDDEELGRSSPPSFAVAGISTILTSNGQKGVATGSGCTYAFPNSIAVAGRSMCGTKISNLPNWPIQWPIKMDGGQLHGLTFSNQGNAYAWGTNGWGEIGIGTQSLSENLTQPLFPPLLDYVVVALPANGSLKTSTGTAINSVPFTLPDNIVNYTPNLDFVSPPTDPFNFKVNDGIQDSNIAAVTVTVNPTTDFSISSSGSSLKAPQTGASGTPNPTILVSPVAGFNSNVTASMQACTSSLASSCNDTNSFPLGASVTFLPDDVVTSAEYNNLTSFRFNTSATAPGTYYFRIKGVGGSPSVTRYSSIISLAVVDLTISSFTADPSSGAAPLNDVDLTAGVGGSAIGTVNFKFHCDAPASPGVWEHSFDGVDITVVDAIPVNRIDMEGHTHSTQRLSGGQFKVFDLCDYGTAGTYTPRVKVERDVANPAEQTVSVQVDSVLTLTVQVNGLGKIEGNGINWDPDGVDGTVNNTPADQTETYADNTPVSLTATAGTGSVFDHWQSDVALPCTGGPFNPVCDFNITEDINPLIAVFDTPLLRVTPNETIIRVNQSFQFEAWYDPDGDDVGEYKVTRCAGAGANPDYPGDAAKNCVGSITWNTSDSAVASINLEGSILAVSRGTTAISATYNAIDSNSNAMVRVIRYKWEER